MLLYSWLSDIYCTPGPDSSNLIKTEKAVPTKPANNANIKYNVPMSFAFEDKNHLSIQSKRDIWDILSFFFKWSESVNVLFLQVTNLAELESQYELIGVNDKAPIWLKNFI